MGRDIVHFLDHMTARFGDLSSIRVGPQRLVLVAHPELIHEVLVARHSNFRKTWVVGNAEEGLGRGILTSTGDFHRIQRKLILPAFHRQRIQRYAETMVAVADGASQEFPAGSPVDMAVAMRQLTLSVVARTLFGADVAGEADEIGHAINELAGIYMRVKSPLGPLLNRLPFLPVNRRFERARQRLDKTILRMIAHRQDTSESRDDLLSMLLSVRYDDGTVMPDDLIRDEAVSIFLAGHETTGITLTWALYALSQQPDLEAAFHEELANVVGDRLPEPADVERLPLTRKIIAETTRLYPAIYLIPRRVVETCTLGGFRIPSGAFIFVSVYSVHRDPRFFPDPERFDPHRWTPQVEQNLPRYAYCAFGGGHHSCMGEGFAWTEAMLVLAVIGQRWKCRVAPGHTVALNPLVNLRPRGGMPMVLTRR